MTGSTGSTSFDPIAVSAESTVVAEHVSEPVQETAYQSEAALERQLIDVLRSQAYEYLPLTSEPQLIANLRAQLESLNGIDVLRPGVGALLPAEDRGLQRGLWRRRRPRLQVGGMTRPIHPRCGDRRHDHQGGRQDNQEDHPRWRRQAPSEEQREGDDHKQQTREIQPYDPAAEGPHSNHDGNRQLHNQIEEDQGPVLTIGGRGEVGGSRHPAATRALRREPQSRRRREPRGGWRETHVSQGSRRANADRIRTVAIPPNPLLVVRPHPEHLHHALVLEDLIHETMLDVDAPGIGSRQVADQLLERGGV